MLILTSILGILRRWYFLVAALIAVMFVFGTVLAIGITGDRVFPGVSTHGYPMYNYNDYYQYVYMIKSGQEGILYFRNVYTHSDTIPMVIGPQYTLFGFLTGFIIQNPYTAYAIFRLLALGGFLSAIFMLI